MRRAFRPFLNDGWLVLHCATVAIPAWWALVLSLDGDTFASPAYRYMQALGSEHDWALWSAVVAVFSGSAWLIRNQWVWLASCVTLAMWHGTVALTVWQANTIGTGAGTYAILAAAATVKLLRDPYAHSHR